MKNAQNLCSENLGNQRKLCFSFLLLTNTILQKLYYAFFLRFIFIYFLGAWSYSNCKLKYKKHICSRNTDQSLIFLSSLYEDNLNIREKIRVNKNKIIHTKIKKTHTNSKKNNFPILLSHMSLTSCALYLLPYPISTLIYPSAHIHVYMYLILKD